MEQFRERTRKTIELLRGRLGKTGGDENARIRIQIDQLKKTLRYQSMPKTAGTGTVGEATRRSSRDHGGKRKTTKR